MELPPEEDRRANRATGFSMLLSVVLVAIALWNDANWPAAFYMVLGGLAIQVISGLLGFAILKPVLQRRWWAILFVRVLWPMVPVAIALYMAGIFTLVIKGFRATYSALFGSAL